MPSQVANLHERIVTPNTDPDRWTDLEAALFRAGLFGWQVSDGGWGSGDMHCRVPSKEGASFGHCDLHDAEMLIDRWPDGTPRWNTNPNYQNEPGYEARVQAALEAHQRQCTKNTCEFLS